MSRRTGGGDLGFGSDSFLDIIANIVGILIILIVVAGVRVSQTPVAPVAETAAPPADAVAEAPREVVPNRTTAVTTSAVVAPKPDLPRRADPELVKRVRALEAELAAVQSETARATTQLDELARHEQELEAQLEAAARRLDAESDEAARRERRLAGIRESLEESESRLAALRTRLDEAEQSQPNVETVEHKLTPISRTVAGSEIHFRLAAGRVAHVPVEALIERMREQIVRQKEWLVKFHKHEGQVGPVDGFMMKYVVERQQLSLVDELRQGQGMMRIGLSEWRIDPEPELRGETADEALRAGAAFLRELRFADPAATLTFWVYPDSFALYRRLQQVAHEAGFVVAARPLPFSVPIAGSPRGTRSAGQ